MCPLSKCTEKIILKDISKHFRDAHINNYHFDKFTIKKVYAYYSIEVLMKNDKTYLVFFDFDDMNFGISICSLEKDAYNYEVQLTSDNGKYAITATAQKIILFNDKEHCFKCSIGKLAFYLCENKTIHFSSKYCETFLNLPNLITK